MKRIRFTGFLTVVLLVWAAGMPPRAWAQEAQAEKTTGAQKAAGEQWKAIEAAAFTVMETAHPDFQKAGTPLNVAVTKKIAELEKSDKAFFSAPDWIYFVVGRAVGSLSTATPEEKAAPNREAEEQALMIQKAAFKVMEEAYPDFRRKETPLGIAFARELAELDNAGPISFDHPAWIFFAVHRAIASLAKNPSESTNVEAAISALENQWKQEDAKTEEQVNQLRQQLTNIQQAQDDLKSQYERVLSPSSAPSPPKLFGLDSEWGILLGYLLILYVLAWWLNKRLQKCNPTALPFKWGYYFGLSRFFAPFWIEVTMATIAKRLPEITSDVCVFSALIYIPLGVFLLKRHRWALVASTVLSFNPIIWVVNIDYIRNRWKELKVITASSEQDVMERLEK